MRNCHFGENSSCSKSVHWISLTKTLALSNFIYNSTCDSASFKVHSEHSQPDRLWGGGDWKRWAWWRLWWWIWTEYWVCYRWWRLQAILNYNTKFIESFYPILEKWEPVEKLLLENKIFLNNFFGEKLFNYLVKFITTSDPLIKYYRMHNILPGRDCQLQVKSCTKPDWIFTFNNLCKYFYTYTDWVIFSHIQRLDETMTNYRLSNLIWRLDG